MERISDAPVPRAVLDELADVPPLPANLYDGVVGRINRQRTLARGMFGLAATLLIGASALTAVRLSASRAAYSADVAADLNGANTYYNGDVCRENSNSYGYYEEVLYQE
jgi:hypothetical protein